MAKEGVDIDGLPTASLQGTSDFLSRLRDYFWKFNSLLFFTSLLIVFAAYFSDNIIAILAASLIATLSFFAGNYLVSSSVSHDHLKECQDAITFGEILLLVDVPRWRARFISRAMQHEYPKMAVCGSAQNLEGTYGG